MNLYDLYSANFFHDTLVNANKINTLFSNLFDLDVPCILLVY